MSRRYTNKELRASLIALDKVLYDICVSAYSQMESMAAQLKELTDKIQVSPTDDHSIRQMNAVFQTMTLVNFMVHPAHETSKRYFPALQKQIDDYKIYMNKSFELGLANCFCESVCDPERIKFKELLQKKAEDLRDGMSKEKESDDAKSKSEQVVN